MASNVVFESGPVALFGRRFWRSSRTPFSLTSMYVGVLAKLPLSVCAAGCALLVPQLLVVTLYVRQFLTFVTSTVVVL